MLYFETGTFLFCSLSCLLLTFSQIIKQLLYYLPEKYPYKSNKLELKLILAI